MNTLRNVAAPALLAVAAFSPVHAEQAAEDAKVATNDVDGSREVLKLLEDRPEIVALVSGGKDKEIADALKAQLNHAGGKQAIADALNEYLSKHPQKDEQDISDLARNGKEKALAKALTANLSKRP